jgi:hypothetical protein
LTLTFTIVMNSETLQTTIWNVGEQVPLPDEARERLTSQLRDFIAESNFGWGERR